MITLIAGSTGAGKTTYARKIAADISAVVYSIDNWMQDLYGQDMPDKPEPQWFYDNQKWYVDRIARCEALIKKIVLQRAKLGHSSILDLGFSTREHRARFVGFFKEHKFEVDIHYLNTPREVRKVRVEERNSSKGETFVMTVDDSLFDYMESIFEPPTEDEGTSVLLVKDI